MPGLLVLLVGLSLYPWQAPRQAPDSPRVQDRVIVEDFEAYKVGGIPRGWKRPKDRALTELTADYMRDNEYFVIKQERDRKFVRVFTDGAVIRILRPNGEGYDWNLRTHPRLRWDWRALQLPEGAREDRVNDTGAALYVTFKMNFLGVPQSIKYTYSSTLPVGTTLSFSGLKVVVVASGRDGFGEWLRMERDVAADYRRLWGGDPPERPLSIMLWSDSDNTKGIAEADFDNIVVLPAAGADRRPGGDS